ncbi:S66 family peptidase [Candidatus Leptofilum sp.]|uniref:S66 family peptidase n=1 Tax=Candidatus Leptofilum sp. TaxID=3241576 RepID=UPI003B5C4C7B
MSNFKRPRKLQRGDRIAVVSPSWGGPNVFPAIYETGLEKMRAQLHLEPVEFPTARMAPDRLAQNPKLRADDINAAFADESIAGIFVSIGGDDSARILPYLNTELILANPKLLLGYSDTTTLLSYLSSQGLVTFHGPTIMAGIAQIESFGDQYKAHLVRLLFSSGQTYEYAPYQAYAEGYPDWAIPENLGKVNVLTQNSGWDWLQKGEDKQGYFWGGCIEVLEFLKGTDFWPARSFFDDKFLLLETSEEVPTPDQVMRILRNYGLQTILDRIQGLVIGRPRGYSEEQKLALRQVVKQIVVDEYGRSDIPIILNFDIGHTDPQFIVPFGVKALISSANARVALVEPIFRKNEPEGNSNAF